MVLNLTVRKRRVSSVCPLLLAYYLLTPILLSFSLVQAEPLVVGYEYDIDQEVVGVLSVDQRNNTVFIHKKYLESRKSHYDPKRSKHIVYEVMDTALGKTIPLLKINSSVTHEIGRVAKVNDGYMIPVIRERKRIELYKYIPGKQTIQPVDLPGQATTQGSLHQTFALANGYITIVASRDTFNVTFNAYNNSIQTQINPNVDDIGKMLTVDDVTELNGRIYIVGSSVGKISNSISNVWICSLESQFPKDVKNSTACSILEMDAASGTRSKFIESTHAIPSLQVLSRKIAFSPATVRIFRLETKPRTVWQRDLTFVEDGENLAIAGICKDEYIFAMIARYKKSVPANIDFREITSNGKEKKVWSQEIAAGDTLVNIYLSPTPEHFFYFANFRKFESVRRQDGWYDWIGYSVDKFNIREACN